jgi:hypothetical protein
MLNDRANPLETLKAINTGLTFLLELAMLTAFGYWGFHGEKSVWMKWGLGIGTPLAVAILWGLCLAPKANHRLNVTGGIILSLGLFCLAALALYQTDRLALAIVLAVIVVVNRALALVWKQW